MKLLIALLTLVLSTPVYAEQKEGGGGSGVAAEFIEAAHDLVQRLEKTPVAGVDSQHLKAIISETKIVTKQYLILRGSSVDAINYPNDKLIEVSVNRWSKLSRTPWVKLQLVFHEYLGILRIDDSNYQISRQILKSDLCFRDHELVKSIEFELRRSCDEVTLKDLGFLTELTIRELGSFNLSDFKDLHNLSKLEINTKLVDVVITKEFVHLFPSLFTLDINARTTVIMPKAFKKSAGVTYLAFSNPRLVKDSFEGLNAAIVAIKSVSEANKDQVAKSLEEEGYYCSDDETTVPSVFLMNCGKYKGEAYAPPSRKRF